MPSMTFITGSGKQQTVDAPLGLSVMEIAQKHNIDKIEGACGGSLACATCHVYVQPDWWVKSLQGEDSRTDEEEDMLDLAFDIRKTSRLSCQIRMTEELDGLVVAVPGVKTPW